jgi:hypothetical protein
MNAVALDWRISSQNRDAENVFPSASVAPASITEDSATVSALLWYTGSGQYSVSLPRSRRPSPPKAASARSHR